MIDVSSIPQIKSYDDRASALRFLLGGIGTGNISLDARGELCDFEIFNSPNKGVKLPYSFFAMRYAFEDGTHDELILEVMRKGFTDEPMGAAPGRLQGMPRFERGVFSSAYPFANIEMRSDEVPFAVTLQAFTPFIPLNDRDSGLPGFCLTYRVKNLSDRPAQVSVAGTMPNACGYDGMSDDGMDKMFLKADCRNRAVRLHGLRGVAYETQLDSADLAYGTMALLTPDTEGVSVKPNWLNEGWIDGATEFWRDFAGDGWLTEVGASGKQRDWGFSSEPERFWVGSVACRKEIAPGEAADFVFYLTWHFPNRYGWWPDGHILMNRWTQNNFAVFRNYYATVWPDALSAAVYLHEQLPRLEGESERFARALFSSTLDRDVIDAAASNITVLRSPTCFRIADGSMHGWEGCFARAGSCVGTYTMVWGYAQTLANLFPALEITMRETEFLWETDDEGGMKPREKRRLGGPVWENEPDPDSPATAVLRVYREWKMTGDDAFLRRVWDKLAKVVDFARSKGYVTDQYDMIYADDQKGIRYDQTVYGAVPGTNTKYCATLKAAAEMAAYLGQEKLAEKWRDQYRRCSAAIDRWLYNGEYYQQYLEGDIDAHKYQCGSGCGIRQIIGQDLAYVYGLGDILPREHVRSAFEAVWRYNYREKMGRHKSLGRGYVMQDEPGVVAVTWPHGGRPQQTNAYSDEAWSGMEYTFAATLVHLGYIDWALRVVRGTRSRYDGYRRSPFNEPECGNHYARTMASWAVLNAFSGLQVDLPHGRVTIDPKVSQDHFRCFYATGREWGVAHQERQADGSLKQWFEPLYAAENAADGR